MRHKEWFAEGLWEIVLPFVVGGGRGGMRSQIHSLCFTLSVCLCVSPSLSLSPSAGVLAAKTTGTQTCNESSAEAGRAETWKEPEPLFPP